MTPAGVLDRVLPRWRAALASRYSPDDLDSFIERNRPALESLVGQAMARQRSSARVQTPHWFELYNPRGGVPRETLPGYRRARELAVNAIKLALRKRRRECGQVGVRPKHHRRLPGLGRLACRAAGAVGCSQNPAQLVNCLQNPLFGVGLKIFRFLGRLLNC